MTVIWLKNIEDSLKGRILNVFIRISANTYVAKINKRIRNSTIKLIEENIKNGQAIIAWYSSDSQKIEFKSIGNEFEVLEFENINLICERIKNEQLNFG